MSTPDGWPIAVPRGRGAIRPGRRVHDVATMRWAQQNHTLRFWDAAVQLLSWVGPGGHALSCRRVMHAPFSFCHARPGAASTSENAPPKDGDRVGRIMIARGHVRARAVLQAGER